MCISTCRALIHAQPAALGAGGGGGGAALGAGGGGGAALKAKHKHICIKLGPDLQQKILLYRPLHATEYVLAYVHVYRKCNCARRDIQRKMRQKFEKCVCVV